MTRAPLLTSLSRMLRCERGDPIVEFILVLPLMLVLGFGVMEIGRILWYQHFITKGVRDGTRYLTRVPLAGGISECETVTGPKVDTATGLALGGHYWPDPDPNLATVTVTLCPIPNDDGAFYGPNPLRIVRMTASVPVAFPILDAFLDTGEFVTFTISNEARHIGQ